MLFSKYLTSKEKQDNIINEIDEMKKLYTFYRNNPYFKTPDNILNKIKEVFDSKKYSIL